MLILQFLNVLSSKPRKLILAPILSKRPCRFDFVMIALSKVSSIKLSRHYQTHCKDAVNDIAQILRSLPTPIVYVLFAFVQIR